MNPRNINIEEYNYELPESRIAKFPTEIRGESKLLISTSNGFFIENFRNIHNYIPSDSLVVFNETKVIHARILFKKKSGASIEIFLLEPHGDKGLIEKSLASNGISEWNCFVGNLKKWKGEVLVKNVNLNGEEFEFKAERLGAEDDHQIIKFSWTSDLTLGEIIEKEGFIPLPPYLKRESTASDFDRYQTVYARNSGSVAAPTAGLHFTSSVFEDLNSMGIKRSFITLNVGAGTFKPVKSSIIGNHDMHIEKISVSKQVIKDIIEFKRIGITAVGTTTTRTLESLYWFGVLLEHDPESDFNITQWLPYDIKGEITLEKSMRNVLKKIQLNNSDYIQGQSQLIIAPGYEFKVVDRLITNFHQPKSTLLLLVSAFYGKEWKNAYEFALNNNFNFLSYGDSCIFIK